MSIRVHYPANPVVLRQHDTQENIVLQVTGLPDPYGAAVTFSLWDETAGAPLWRPPKSAAISNINLDPNTQLFAADLSCQLQTGDAASVGRFIAAFEITFSGGAKLELPADDSFVVIVHHDLAVP